MSLATTADMRLAPALLLFTVTTLAACSAHVDDGSAGGGPGGAGKNNPANGGGNGTSDGSSSAGTPGGPNGTNPSVGPGANLPPAAAGFPQPFDVGVTYARTLYVGPAGNDTSGTGTNTAPYRTVQRALRGAAPGTDVVLLPGRHTAIGSIGSPQGTATAPFRIRAEAGAIIDASGGEVGLAMSDARYVVLEGLVIENSPVHGMNIDDGGTYATPSDHVVIRRVTLRAIGSGGNNDCLKMSGVDHFYVTESEIAGCNAGEGIDMVGCHDGFVGQNHFHDTRGTAVQAKGGSRNVTFHGNLFENIAVHALNLGGSTGDPYVRPTNAPFEGENLYAIANVVRGSGQAAVDFQGCNGCVAANNTILDPGRWVVRILPGSRDTSTVTSQAGVFINNVVIYDAADVSVITNVGPNTQPGTFTFGNNLYFARTGQGFNGTHGSGIPAETGSIFQQNPNLAADQKPPSGSPVIGRGRALPSGAAAFDFTRQAVSNPPDLGAYRAP